MGPGLVLMAGGHMGPQVGVALVLLLTEVAPIPNTHLVTVPALHVLPHFLFTFAGKVTKSAGKVSLATRQTFFQLAQDELGRF